MVCLFVTNGIPRLTITCISLNLCQLSFEFLPVLVQGQYATEWNHRCSTIVGKSEITVKLNSVRPPFRFYARKISVVYSVST